MKSSKIKKLLTSSLLAAALIGIGSLTTTVNASDTITVGTYNLRAPKKNDTNAQRTALQNNNVEIAGLQEINYNNHRFSGKTKYNTLTNFKNNYFKSVYYGNAINFAGGGYGIATVSTLPFEKKSVKTLYSYQESTHFKEFKAAYNNYNPDKKSTVKKLDNLSNKYGKKLVEPRVVTRVVVDKNGKKIAFYDTHLSYESTKLRRKQFKELANMLSKDKTEYKVLVGDFNDDQDTTEWRIFSKKFNLANGQNGIWHDTFIGDDDTMRVNSIDNIITSKNITINNVRTIDTTASDHVPLVADLTLN